MCKRRWRTCLGLAHQNLRKKKSESDLRSSDFSTPHPSAPHFNIHSEPRRPIPGCSYSGDNFEWGFAAGVRVEGLEQKDVEVFAGAGRGTAARRHAAGVFGVADAGAAGTEFSVLLRAGGRDAAGMAVSFEPHLLIFTSAVSGGAGDRLFWRQGGGGGAGGGGAGAARFCFDRAH